MSNAILNAVYNNYLTTYAPKSVTQYDTHKKSELRGIYNSIVKLNREAPWYLPTTNRDTQRYAIDLKENARQLHNVISESGGADEESIINRKTAFSSDENLISASYIGSQEHTEQVPALEVSVQALATTQENLGRFLSDTHTGMPADMYSFDVNINDMSYEFQFTIGSAETNRSVQERLERLVNNSNIGIKADLLESDGKTALRLTSENSGQYKGQPLQFTITDDRTSKRTGAVEYLGLDYVTREASNAEFTVNGEEHSAASNHFTLGGLYEVQLHSTTPEGEPVRLGLKTDIDSLADNIQTLIGGYNDFLKAMDSYRETQQKSHQLMREVQNIAGHYSPDLDQLGIIMQEDGTLSLDRNLLRQTASESEDLKETFGSVRSLAHSLLRKTNQVSLNPMNYVQKTVVAYKNPGHNFTSPYSPSAYSGMMFNSYC